MRVSIWSIVVFAATVVSGPAVAQFNEANDAESIKRATTVQSAQAAVDIEKAVSLIVSRTNDFRRGEDLSAVEVNPKLRATAQYFADYMARTDKYGHTADGNHPAERAKKHDYTYCIVSENIAYQYSSIGFATQELAENFFKGWKKSPGHRKNMLDADVTETGVAIAQSDETGYYYAVQMFGRPKSRTIEFTITNQSDSEVEYEIDGRTFPLPPSLIRTHQRCRPSRVTFQWPDSDGESRTVQPGNGAQLVVQKESGNFVLSKK